MIIYYRDEVQSYIKASLIQALRPHAECIQKEPGILMNFNADNINADAYTIGSLFKIYQQTFGMREWLDTPYNQTWQEDLHFIFRYQDTKNPHALISTMKELWYYGPHILKNPISNYSRDVKSYARQIHIEYYRVKSQLRVIEKYMCPKSFPSCHLLTICGNFESKHEIGDLLAYDLLQKHIEACIVLQSLNGIYVGYKQSVFKMHSYNVQSFDIERFILDINANNMELSPAQVMKKSCAKVISL